jgi:hypothetical protein
MMVYKFFVRWYNKNEKDNYLLMILNKTLVVSNHANHDLEWLRLTYEYGFSPENTIIYDRTPEDFPQKSKIDHLGKVIKSPNVGSNPYDIGRYIFDHYDNLPDIMIHIKGNLLQKKYTTEERFIYALESNWFVPIDGGTLCDSYFPQFVNDNWFAQPMEWEERIESEKSEEIKNMKVYPRISNLKEFIQDLFVMDNTPKFLSFAPGANYAVPKNSILKYSKNFYKKMMYYTDYNNNPIESHWFERILQMAWQGCLKENFSYIVK